MGLIDQDALRDLINDIADKRVEEKLSHYRKLWEVERGDRLLGRLEVAKRLNIHVNTLDTRIKDKKIKSCLVGNLIKFKESEVLRYLGTL